jgi:adenosylcobinamide kinase/adenosylcobinamide-phosphate guanylyltransferase
MITLILGENGSGKSAYAESIACFTNDPRYYIATMVPYGAEGAERIEKHKRQRKGMGFQTLELPYFVGGAPVSPDATVLLEDGSNLLANQIFAHGGSVDAVLSDIFALESRCRRLIVVSIIGLDLARYDGDTRAYIELLDRLNTALFERAACVVELIDGSAMPRKGELPCAY